MMHGIERTIGRMICIAGLSAGAFAASAVTYDTAWTFVYDGGKSKDGDPIPDNFRDVKVLPNGIAVCAGETRDTNRVPNALLMELSPAGKPVQKKLLWLQGGIGAAAIEVSAKGGFLVGGQRFGAPLLMRLDAGLSIKSSAWYYDSIANKDLLARRASINSILETQDGRIVTAAGDAFPDNRGQALNNYAAYLEFDTAGAQARVNEWLDNAGYELGGWSIALGESQGYLLAGNQALYILDTTGNLRTRNRFSFSLTGVGTVANNVSRVHKLRDGSRMVAGQAYEEDCWTRYQRLYYDAWWSPLSASGKDDSRYVAGVSGANDRIFDFAQLADGRIAFVGAKGTAVDSGIWVFVTDSTGKTVEWQRQYNLPGLDQGSARSNIQPFAIAAAPDGGFIVAAEEGAKDQNNNACAFKFVAKPTTSSFSLSPAAAPLFFRRDGKLVFTLAGRQTAEAELRFFDLRGEPAGSWRGSSRGGRIEFAIESSRREHGAFLWQLRAGSEVYRGFLAVTE
jgi:hypothetical protein